MAWRYCIDCGNGQDQITIEDIEAVSYDEHAKVQCVHCRRERDDDTPGLRILILVQEVMRLRAAQTAPEKL